MLVLKKHFFFGNYKKVKIASIYFKKSRSNFFVTLTDSNNKVIISKSSGCVITSNSKRRKKSPQAVEDIMRSLKPYLVSYKITHIQVILKQRINLYIRFIVKELELYGIDILDFKLKLKHSYNGMRKRKLRRL